MGIRQGGGADACSQVRYAIVCNVNRCLARLAALKDTPGEAEAAFWVAVGADEDADVLGTCQLYS